MNSAAYANRAISPFRRFNSQRIELFHIPAGRYKMQWQKFQFQTGWNSTIEGRLQIPTKRGFNSQRDGILRLAVLHNLFRLSVSIPNGMEFYSHKALLYLSVPVSIPNGMEFYVFKTSLLYSSNSFQFPTGWNSTKNKQGEVQASRGFNSQRDGILPFGEIGYRLTKSSFNSQRDGIPLKILNEKL